MTTKTEVTRYTDTQAEASKLDSVYAWFDVRVTVGEYSADFIVGTDRTGKAFDVEWVAGDYLGNEGMALAVSAAVDTWAKGE